MSQRESGARGLFLATSDRYAGRAGGEGLVSPAEGLPPAKKSGGGIFLVHSLGGSADSENALARMRQKGVDQTVCDHTQKVFNACDSQASSSKIEV